MSDEIIVSEVATETITVTEEPCEVVVTEPEIETVTVSESFTWPESSGGGNIVVSPSNPGMSDAGLWIQTGLGVSGTDMTFWVEDGV